MNISEALSQCCNQSWFYNSGGLSPLEYLFCGLFTVQAPMKRSKQNSEIVLVPCIDDKK